MRVRAAALVRASLRAGALSGHHSEVERSCWRWSGGRSQPLPGCNKWVDLLRPNPYRAGIKAVLSLDNWVRGAFRRNQPYDKFVRDLLTAQGSTWRNGATVVFRDRPETTEIASSVSQLFLGVRLECAKCHHHPFEVWSQDDFYGFASYFARIGHKGSGLSPPISGGEEMIFVSDSGQVQHGRTGAIVSPKPLLGTAEPIRPRDPRDVLVDWMLEPAQSVFRESHGQSGVDRIDGTRHRRTGR